MAIISSFKICISPVHYLHVSFLPRVKMNSTNQSALNVQVFIAQWQSTAALTQRPWVRIPLKSRKMFAGLFAIAQIAITTATIISSFKICISAVHIIFMILELPLVQLTLETMFVCLNFVSQLDYLFLLFYQHVYIFII